MYDPIDLESFSLSAVSPEIDSPVAYILRTYHHINPKLQMIARRDSKTFQDRMISRSFVFAFSLKSSSTPYLVHPFRHSCSFLFSRSRIMELLNKPLRYPTGKSHCHSI